MNRGLLVNLFILLVVATYANGDVGNPTLCCFPNTEPKRCVTECNMKTCANLNKKTNGTCSDKCLPFTCFCKDGFVANKCMQCVKPEQCGEPCEVPPTICTGKNEELIDCYDPRRARVCNPGDPGDEPSCPPEDAPFPLDLLDVTNWNDRPGSSCILGICDCKKGFRRNECGLCVKPELCGKKCKPDKCDACSDPNEIRYKSWRPCKARSCESINNPMTCQPTLDKSYVNKCDCKENYLRDECGRCVPKNDCFKTVKPCKCNNPCGKIKNTEPSQINSCTKHTCYKATVTGLRCKPDIHSDCDCIDGFWFNKDGQCVRKEECTQEDIEATEKLIDDDDVWSRGETLMDE